MYQLMLSWQSKLSYMIRKEMHTLKFRIKVHRTNTLLLINVLTGIFFKIHIRFLDEFEL